MREALKCRLDMCHNIDVQELEEDFYDDISVEELGKSKSEFFCRNSRYSFKLQSWPKVYRTACRNNNFLFKFDLILNSISPRAPHSMLFSAIPIAWHGVIIPHGKSMKSK